MSWKVVTCLSAVGIGGISVLQTRKNNIRPNLYQQNWIENSSTKRLQIDSLPSRNDQVNTLKNDIKNPFDICIIGGGATGTGIALDGITRGLNVALIESNDFASGTSSRSTKLVHGGPRYLETALTTLNKEQFDLVIESLKERRNFLNISPYLSSPQPLIVPVYDNYFNLLKYYIGIKIYDFIAWYNNGLISCSYYLSSTDTLKLYPLLKPIRSDSKLIGSIVYSEGYHNDSRTCLNVALTAISYGATVVNHVEVIDFIKDNDGKIIGVKVCDNLNNKQWNIYSKIVINATGCFVDKIRKMDNKNITSLIVPSRGTHLVLSENLSLTNDGKKIGFLIPKTRDNRIATVTPFENKTIIGTTDILCDIEQYTKPTKSEVDQLLFEVNDYLNCNVDIKDINSIWGGIRPLVKIPRHYEEIEINDIDVIIPRDDNMESDNDGDNDNNDNTANISRKHVIELSKKSGLITVSGGKWTIYRKMAEDVLDVICGINNDINNKSNECVTRFVKLLGTEKLSSIDDIDGISEEIINHLIHNYGHNTLIILDIINKNKKKGNVLIDGYPFTEAEIEYCTKYEYGDDIISILSHRTRLCQLDRNLALKVLPIIIQIMAPINDWDDKMQIIQQQKAIKFLNTMHC